MGCCGRRIHVDDYEDGEPRRKKKHVCYKGKHTTFDEFQGDGDVLEDWNSREVLEDDGMR